MLQNGLLRLISTPVQGTLRRFQLSQRYLSQIDESDGASEEDQKAARQWLANYNPSIIPRNICEISYSRSSGPGGQNVNK